MPGLTGQGMIAYGDTSQVFTSAVHPVGTRMFDPSGNEYIFGKGVANTELYSVVTLDEVCQSSLSALNAKGRVGIAQAAIVANTWGWYLIYGSGLAKVAAGFADNGLVYLTATPGTVDDAVVAGDLVVGAIGRSAISGGLATLELDYPFVTDTLG